MPFIREEHLIQAAIGILVVIFLLGAIFFIQKLASAIGSLRRFTREMEQPEKVKKKKAEVKPEKIISQKDMKEAKMYVEASERDYFEKKKWNFRNWLDRRRQKKKPHKIILVEMHLNNGKIKEFIVPDTWGFFYNRGMYYFDGVSKKENVSSNIWKYVFHEDFSLPIDSRVKLTKKFKMLVEAANKNISKTLSKPLDQEINAQKIKEAIELSKVIENPLMTNPTVLERISKSEFIKNAVAGAMIGRIIRIFLVILIITVLLVFLDFIVDLISSGILEEIGTYFKK